MASLLAEYTDAPASFTMRYCTFTGISFNSSTITCSDSRDAVPFPSEIRAVSYTHLVEDCVNKVGVDLNTASVSLLEYISGISKTIAKNRCV